MTRPDFVPLARAALIAGSVLAATVAHAAPADAPSMITRPEWKRQPTQDELWSAVPALAVEKGVSGRATIACDVSAYGLLQACKVESETPAGYGFGEAAKALAPVFQLRPTVRDGVAFAGGRVTIPLVWNLSGVAPGDIHVKGRTMLTEPPWAAAPGWSQAAAAWPRRAGGVAEGFANLRCGLDGDGVPTACKLLSQAPAGGGFGDAAQGLAKHFRLAFSEADRPTLKTLVVDIPFHFVNPARADQRKLGSPRWVRTLSPAGMATLYPAGARQAGVMTGKASVRCTATANGELTGCAVTRDDPTGAGFGPAALEAAKAMRMNPWTQDGQPADGLPLTLPIRFTWDDKASAQGGQ